MRQHNRSYIVYIYQCSTYDGQVGVVKNVLSEDAQTRGSGEYTDAVLKNAPDTEDGYVKVKQIF